MTITSHEGRFSIREHGQKFIPLISYTLEALKPKAGMRNVIDGIFKRSDRSDQPPVTYKIIYNEGAPASEGLLGATLHWDALPPDRQHVYLALVVGYQLPTKTFKEGAKEIYPILQDHYYITVATELELDPQGSAGNPLSEWTTTVLTIAPTVLGNRNGMSDFKGWELYHLSVRDAVHMGNELQVQKIADLSNGTFVFHGRAGIEPSGMYFFGTQDKAIVDKALADAAKSDHDIAAQNHTGSDYTYNV
ncbi:MAG: hypothetical protein KDE46_12895 [Caldilineaceae bacterium]|nr:hypothetical protein [Caldilineaceae bacterium]